MGAVTKATMADRMAQGERCPHLYGAKLDCDWFDSGHQFGMVVTLPSGARHATRVLVCKGDTLSGLLDRSMAALNEWAGRQPAEAEL
ncbi:hypothetical protein KLEP181_gp05 [Paracoccus phage vB_PmaP_KLEP18-1]|nr:hypothetical protein KLEP181_gp05 [Paracoccus phage vB_PmaP_KLEP18-1]